MRPIVIFATIISHVADSIKQLMLNWLRIKLSRIPDWIMTISSTLLSYRTLVHAVNHLNWISFQIKGVQCPTVFHRGLHWAAFDRWLQRVLHRPSLSLCLQLHPALDYCIVHAHQLLKGLHPKAPTHPPCTTVQIKCISLDSKLYFFGERFVFHWIANCISSDSKLYVIG